MSIAELKSSLHNLINGIEDKSLLSKAYAILSTLTRKAVSKTETNDYDQLPIEVKEAIEEGIAELDNAMESLLMSLEMR